MKGFKAFNADLTCRDYQFEIGKTFIHDGPVILCKNGFHFCTDAQDILKFYCDKSMRICEIEASGEITDPEEDCSKRSYSNITIVREILFEEFFQYITSSKWAYRWALNFGNHDIMMPLITESRYAYYWALNFGNRDTMLPRITEPHWLELFNKLN